MVCNPCAGKDGCLCGIRQRKFRTHEWIFNGYVSLIRNVNLVVDTYVPAAHGGNPVPAYGGVHSGVVRSKYAAVFVRSIWRVFFGNAVAGVVYNLDVKLVGAVLKYAGNVKGGGVKGATNLAHLLPVEAHFRLVVYAVEVEKLAGRRNACLKGTTVQEIAPEV